MQKTVSCASLCSKSEVMLAFSEEVGNLVSPVVGVHPEAPEVHCLPWLPQNWHLFYGFNPKLQTQTFFNHDELFNLQELKSPGLKCSEN